MAEISLNRWMVRHPFMLKAVGLAVVVVAILLLATIPFFENASSLSSKLSTRRKEASELAQKVTILSGLDQAVLTERVQILDHALPPRKDVVLYLSTVDGLVRELNLNFGGLSLAPGEVTEASLSASTKQANSRASVLGLHTLDTDLKIDGSEDNIYTFLRILENSAPLMQIKDVKLTRNQGGDHFTLSLRLGMLYAPATLEQVKGQITLFDAKEEAYFQDLASFRRFEPVVDLNADLSGLGKLDLFQNSSESETQ